MFFDRGLCAHYFTYMPRAGQAHFVLFDTPRSVRSKLDLAQRLGLYGALLAAPEQVREALPALAGCDCVPVRDMTLERLLEEGYSG